MARWTKIGWNDFMGVLARALEISSTHQIPKDSPTFTNPVRFDLVQTWGHRCVELRFQAVVLLGSEPLSCSLLF